MAGLLGSFVDVVKQPTKANFGLLFNGQNELPVKDLNESFVYSPKPGLVFVGQEHGKNVKLPSEIKNMASQFGAFYEGAGGDKLSDIKYKGSWDDAAAKSVKGYPAEFLYTMFTNTDVNKQKEFLKSNDTIFDSLLKNQDKFGYFKDRKFDKGTLTNFLQSMGQEFLQESKKQATSKNVSSFIDKGEKTMWESDDTSARQMANKANESRQKWLLSQPKGVFFVGSDHLQDLKRMQNK
jgi:hypothetical protein